MLLFLLACTPPPAQEGATVLAPFDDGDRPDDDDDDGDTDETDATDSDTDLSVIEEPPPALVINEVMVDNALSFYVDGGYPDWVELYNGSVETVALTRVTLSDGSGQVFLGADGEIAPGAFALIYADGAQESNHAPFSLNNEDESLTLSVDGRVVDRIATGELDEDLSWARFPDAGEWSPTAWTTPGESNGTTPSDTLTPDTSIFGLDTVYHVTIAMDNATRQGLNTSATTYHETSLSIGDTLMDPVGVRLRGSMTYQSMSSKAAFKLDLNRYDPSIRFREMEKFNVLNMYYEASLMREYLAYEMFRAFGVPSIRNAYAWVDITVDSDAPEDYGLYLLSQAYDDTFLREWYGNSDGYLWEPNSGDFTSGAGSWDCEEGACDTSVIEPVRDLLRSSATDANVADMEAIMDLDSVLREIAMEIATGQWDGYCSPHNYRVYYNPEDGRVSIMPSSLDLCFDNLGYNYGGNYFSCGGSVLAWCLSNEGCESEYISILYEMADLIEAMEIDATIDEIEILIDDYAQADSDTRSQYTYAQHETNVAQVRAVIAALPGEIRAAADAR